MLLGYLTDAMRQTVLIRPDANAAVEIVALTAGATKQQVPSGAVRFLGLLRNINSDGSPGFPITPTTREAMDASILTWHEDSSSGAVDHYLFNPDTPLVFYVYPAPASGVRVEMEYAKDVAAVAALTETLPLANIWSEPLREYVLYRAFSLNAVAQVDGAKALSHLKQYYLAIGEEARAKAIFNPYMPTLAQAQAGVK